MLYSLASKKLFEWITVQHFFSRAPAPPHAIATFADESAHSQYIEQSAMSRVEVKERKAER